MVFKRVSDIIGCSPEELKVLSLKECHGDWHIDHVIPCAAFDHTIEKEIKACWNFKNLRALWGTENIKKSSAFDETEKEQYMLRLFN